MDRNALFAVLLSSLRYALKRVPFSETVRKSVTPELLPPLLCLSKEQNLTHLVGFALKEQGLLPKGDKTAAAFEKSILTALYLTERIEKERVILCGLLEENEIPHIPLKGAVIRHLYPETWMRTSTDADVLIPREHLERATLLLREKLGYTVADRGGHDVAFLTPKGLHMELHFALVEKDRMPEAFEILERVWEYTLPKEGKRFERILSGEFFLFYHIAHMAKHLNNGGVGLRFFADLSLICEKLPPDETAFLAMAQKGGIADFYRASKSLADHFTKGTPLEEKGFLLLDFVLGSGIFGKTESYVAIRRGRKGKLRYVFDRLFPSYDVLLPLYPSLEGKKPLLFLYQLRRIGRHLKDGGLKRSGREFSQNLSHSKEETDRMAKLLTALGLHFHD